jgi:hypothetical protein
VHQCHGSGFLFDADPDSDPSFQIKAQTLEKVLMKWLIFHTFGLVTYKVDEDPDPDFFFMRIQVTKMIRIRILQQLTSLLLLASTTILLPINVPVASDDVTIDSLLWQMLFQPMAFLVSQCVMVSAVDIIPTGVVALTAVDVPGVPVMDKVSAVAAVPSAVDVLRLLVFPTFLSSLLLLASPQLITLFLLVFPPFLSSLLFICPCYD